jgi:hypothetical protein
MIIFSLLLQNNIKRQQQTVHPTPMISIQSSTIQRTRLYTTDFQLMRLNLLQILIFFILNGIPSFHPLYAFVTNSQVKCAEQRAIDIFISNTSLFLAHTYAAVCVHLLGCL